MSDLNIEPGSYDCWRVATWIATDSNGPRRVESDPILDRETALAMAREAMDRNDRYHGPNYKREWIETSLAKDVRMLLPGARRTLVPGEVAWVGRCSPDWYTGDVVGVIRSSIDIFGSGAIEGET